MARIVCLFHEPHQIDKQRTKRNSLADFPPDFLPDFRSFSSKNRLPCWPRLTCNNWIYFKWKRFVLSEIITKLRNDRKIPNFLFEKRINGKLFVVVVGIFSRKTDLLSISPSKWINFLLILSSFICIRFSIRYQFSINWEENENKTISNRFSTTINTNFHKKHWKIFHSLI